MDKRRTVMPIIAGILDIVSAGFKLFILVCILGLLVFVPVSSFPIRPVAIVPIIMVPLVAWIALAIIGGIFTLQRKRWGIALAGSIVAILPFSLLGIAATILVVLSKDEFE